MYYFVKVQPWLHAQLAAAEKESIVSLESELGRSFLVDAKNQNQAIARVVRDVVSIRKATPKELIGAGKSGEAILSADDPAPAPPAVEPPPQQQSLVAGEPPPNASTATVTAAPAQEQPWADADLARARTEAGTATPAEAIGF